MAEPQLTPPTAYELRDRLTAMVVKDLHGPAGALDEELDKNEHHVYGRYLVGMLAPSATEVPAEEQDDIGSGQSNNAEENNADVCTPPTTTFFPNSMGLSFMVKGATKALSITSHWGRYKKIKSSTQTNKDGTEASVWKRQHHAPEPLDLELKEGKVLDRILSSEDHEVVLRGKMRRTPQGWLITLFMVNTAPPRDRIKKDEAWVFQPNLRITSAEDEGQPVFVKRLDRKHDLANLDPLSVEEMRTMEMLYRHRLEFAVGHGVSVHAILTAREAHEAVALETTFLPQAEVERQTARSEEDDAALEGLVLDMKELAEMPTDALLRNLRQMHGAYTAWIAREAAKVNDLAEQLQGHEEAARQAMERCSRAARRIAEGIDLLEQDAVALEAFRFANRAMWQQRVRSTYTALVRKKKRDHGSPIDEFDQPRNRSWRMFQLAFVLLNLPSLTRLDHPERSDEHDATADLLWFATGGGKTEAYLGLTAYTLAMRRLQGTVDGHDGANGVAVLMRYTLRLLTLQQFQRAAALICACEIIRRGDEAKWGTVHFRLGLWVGYNATPNSLAKAAEMLEKLRERGARNESSPLLQLVSCPWCGHPIRSNDLTVQEGATGSGRMVTYCGDTRGRCAFSAPKVPGEGLPIMIVDQEIYRRPPSLLIATVDKFAQMPWKGEVQNLFGRITGECERHGFLSPEIEASSAGCTGVHPASRGLSGTTRIERHALRPPDLIIQDELHLISGPLGSMVALYETAVDELCTWTVNGKRVRPKVIASTATIRRASVQVRRIFQRKLEVFPPQGTNITDSFFAIQRVADEQNPGRRYIGICAYGHRYPAAMIRTYVAVMAAANTLYETYGSSVDPWMTATGYFNSIRELAGTRRLLEDDIKTRLYDADQRGFKKRRLRAIDELTSRRSGSAIPKTLERLEQPFDPRLEEERKRAREERREVTPLPYDAILATNMISVGVDIDRLGLMVVAGQPKNTSEYIQATSRVGRASPGLVLTVYNWARPRDLSHFESFGHYHGTFYKHVEALSVTPFAVRAMDRGLSGVLVSLMRLHGSALNRNTAAGTLAENDALMRATFERIRLRAELVQEDAGISEDVDRMLQKRRDVWLEKVRRQDRGAHVLGYRDAPPNVVGLLLRPSNRPPTEFTCLSSLRDVEATAPLVLDTNPTGLTTEDQ
jgi:hypothetical protein